MFKDFFYRSLAYLKSIFTKDPYEAKIESILGILEETYEKRAAILETEIITLRQDLNSRDERYLRLQQQFLDYLIGEKIQVELPAFPIMNVPPQRRGWDSQRINLENKNRLPKTETEAKINEVESNLNSILNSGSDVG